jgi:TonB-dependent starch-binding outer membrane protein SusC
MNLTLTKKIRALILALCITNVSILRRGLLSSFLFCLSICTVYAQTNQHTVSGKVISDTEQKPLPGVNIVIKGTGNGTVTDVDGDYSIEVSDADVLIFSYIGYNKEEVVVGNKTVLNLSLIEDISKLGEVVVVGYGEMKKASISSAQTTIKTTDIEKTVNTTLDQAIQGRAAGVYVTQNSGQPGGGVSVFIRGVSTLNGSTEPALCNRRSTDPTSKLNGQKPDCRA